MATINSGYTPYYIKSDAIAVFPCANRTNSYASRFTTEYNLTHLGLPNASWISKVDGKITGAKVEKADKISCVINGYFFEFSLKDAFAINGNTLTPLIPQNANTTTNTLTAYIATEIVTDPSKPADPLKKQPQLCALLTQDNTSQSGALDMNDLFLGLAIFVGGGTDPISGATTYSLQLASSGNYPYIGTLPQTPTGQIANNSITADKLGNVIAQGSDNANGITVSLSQTNSEGGLKIDIEVEDDKVQNAALADYATDSGKASLAYNLWHEGINSTEQALNTNVSAATKKPLGVKLTGGAGSGNGTTVAVQLTGGVATSNIYNGAITSEKFASTAKAPKANTADIANKIKIDNTAYTLSISGNVLTID